MKIIRKKISEFCEELTNISRVYHSRKRALVIRNKLQKTNHNRISDNKIKEIKKYCKKIFGYEKCWPWLATYTELRGEFVEGWVPDEYYETIIMKKINPHDKAYISTVKSFDRSLFGDIAQKNYFIIKNGNFIKDSEIIDINEAHNILNNAKKEIVVKLDGDAGKGVVSVEFLNNNEINLKRYLSSRKNYLFQPVAKQHEEISKIYPKSLNTIRLATLFEYGKIPKVLYKKIRIGAYGSRVDSIKTGGRFVMLDDNGCASSKAYNELGYSTEEVHPDTKFKYSEIKVPNFSKVMDTCLKLHLKYPNVGLIAWDIYLDENKEPKLLEWNARNPSMWINEALCGPLWNINEYF